MPGITSVAFGPNNSWIVCGDSGITWGWDLPTPIYNKLNGRNRSCAPTNVAAMGHDEDFVLFFDNTKWWVNHSTLADVLIRDDINGYDVKTFSFGDNGSYILLLNNGMTYWQGVHWRLEQLIRTKNNASIRWVAIGQDDTYFVRFSDGKVFWCGESIDDVLESEWEEVKKVWLSPFDDSYFIKYKNGSTAWNSCQSFSNGRLKDTSMSPRDIYYTNDSISQQFVCGRCIHETARELEEGTLKPDDIPYMEVFEYQGHTFSLNNRRLWALSMADVDSTPVKFVDPPNRVLSKLYNGFEGYSIRLR